VKRREFISLLGGAAAILPHAARAQQGAVPVIGFVYPGTPELSTGVVAAFRKGLGETGFVERRNVMVEFRFAYNDNTRVAELLADLVGRRVAVIVTPGSTSTALAAKAATMSIPVVFSVGTDPVEIGLVTSLSRPGGNVTGITSLNSELAAKATNVGAQGQGEASARSGSVEQTATAVAQARRGLTARAGVQKR
jgi:putative ABC transport system substrate-binding protein